MTDGHIDAKHVGVFLVDDGIDHNRCFTCLAIPNDQFPLTSPNRNHGIYRLETRLKRFFHRLSLNHTQRLAFNWQMFVRFDRSFTVDWLAQWVCDSSKHGLAHGNLHDSAGSLGSVALLNMRIFAKKHDADVILFEVERHAVQMTGKLNQLAEHHFFQAIDASDSVTNLHDFANFLKLDRRLKAFYLFLDDRSNFFRTNLHPMSKPPQ